MASSGPEDWLFDKEVPSKAAIVSSSFLAASA